MKRLKAFFERCPIAFTPTALIYQPLFLAALIFAQTYKTYTAHMIFVFVLLLPIFSVLWIVAARFCISAGFRVSALTVEKRGHASVSVSLENKSPIPFVLASAVAILPNARTAKPERVNFVTTLLPFGRTDTRRTIEFPFCGDFELSLSHVLVYDLTHSVRLRINLDKRESVFVLPRRLSLDVGTQLGAGENGYSGAKDKIGTEPIDVREYRAGDRKKNIHWKLSTKSDELMVRELQKSGEGQIAVICNLDTRFADYGYLVRPDFLDIAKQTVVDALIEGAVGAVIAELGKGNSVTLAWFENDVPVCEYFESAAEFEASFRRFGTSKPCDVSGQIPTLLGAACKNGAAPIIVTPFIDDEAASACIAAVKARANVGGAVLTCTDKRMFIIDDELSAKNDEICERLARAGVRTEKLKF